jgi:hypothetical protein
MPILSVILIGVGFGLTLALTHLLATAAAQHTVLQRVLAYVWVLVIFLAVFPLLLFGVSLYLHVNLLGTIIDTLGILPVTGILLLLLLLNFMLWGIAMDYFMPDFWAIFSFARWQSSVGTIQSSQSEHTNGPEE